MSKDEPGEKLVRARGTIRYAFKRLSDIEFERLCYRLIRLEHPEVEKPADVRDGGVDALSSNRGGAMGVADKRSAAPTASIGTDVRSRFSMR